MRAILLTLLVAMDLLVLAGPASACSCRPFPVPEMVREASAVYIARPRLPDPWPGRSFRVDATLKGQPRHNIRVDVDLVTPLTGSTCSTRGVANEPHVILVGGRRSDGPVTLSLCTEHLASEEAVEDAHRILGEGTRMGWRPDPVWTAQWGAIALIPIAGIVGMARWARSERRWIVDNP